MSELKATLISKIAGNGLQIMGLFHPKSTKYYILSH
jgi:hypothetical protein